MNKEMIRRGMNLYLVTDRSWLKDDKLEDVIESAIKGGVSFVQLREKNSSEEEFIQLAENVKKVTDKYKIPFVINDNVEIAKIVDADGVHIGQSDMEYKQARKILGKDKIIGMSTSNIKMAINAQEIGADYIGVGAVFSTDTKNNTKSVSYETLKEICETVDIPVVAIGGINSENVMQLNGSGVDGIALVSAILSKDNISEASKEMKSKILSILEAK